MDSEAIAGLLLMFAPAHILEGLELSSDNAVDWMKEVDQWDEFSRIETAALALYYSARKGPHRAKYDGTVPVSLNLIHCLVQMARAEEFGTTEGLLEELASERKTIALDKKRATVAKNRSKKSVPTWHEEALELAAKKLPASVIAIRLEKSASQVRRVLSKAKQ